MHERVPQRAFGRVPIRVRAEFVVGTKRKLDTHVEAEQAVEVEGVLEAEPDLVFDLVREAIRVPIGLSPNSCSSPDSCWRKNMFSRNFSQWPEVSQRRFSKIKGVFTSA